MPTRVLINLLHVRPSKTINLTLAKLLRLDLFNLELNRLLKRMSSESGGRLTFIYRQVLE